MSAGQGWVGVDLDGTLAHYEGWRAGYVGEPVPLMLARVQRWLALGMEVRIVTARMVALWDDRAVSVESNTGLVVKREWPQEIRGLFE